MPDKPIYLDYNATTPVAPQVAEAMLPYLTEHFGNPSSSHMYGQITRQAVDIARQQVATLINCTSDEIIFTASGTESNNMVIKGVAEANVHRGRHIITSQIEHPAIIEPCKWLSAQGFEITYLPVNELGMVDVQAVKAALRPDTILASVMLANNEIGTIQPLAEIAELARTNNTLVHTDAAQAVGKITVDVQALGVDFLSVAGHKLYAPKGVGALYVRDGISLPRFMHGASHESNRRAGTENVLEIVGLGAASSLASTDLPASTNHMQVMRDRLFAGLIEEIADIRRNSPNEAVLSNTLNVSFRHVRANELLESIQDRVAASAGAACHADDVKVSAVLEAIKVPLDYAMGTLRLTTGRMTTASDIDRAVEVITNAVKILRKH